MLPSLDHNQDAYGGEALAVRRTGSRARKEPPGDGIHITV
jgi:hypothetical protein